MLKLPHKKWLSQVPKRVRFLGKLCLLSISLHGILLIFLTIGLHKNNNQTMHIILNRRSSDAQIILLPHFKTIPQAVKIASTEKKPCIEKNHTKINTVKKEDCQKLADNMQNKKSANQLITQPMKKKVAKTQPLKKEPIKKVVPAKNNVAQNQKKVATKQIATPDKEPVAQPLKPAQSLQTTTTAESNEQEIIYIGREDKIILEHQMHVQRQIENVWRSPVGLAKDLTCEIAVTLNEHGAVEQLTIEKSSQVSTYDITARSALSHITYPKTMWGKRLIITFKQ